MLFILLQASNFFKLVQILIISGVKFIIAPPVSIEMGFSWIQTIIFTTVGGIIGVVISYYLSAILLKLIRRLVVRIKMIIAQAQSKNFTESVIISENKTPKKIFTRKNKFLAKTIRKYGLFGIAAITPVFLSIPVGTFLANKYYPNKKKVFMALSVSVACWSLIVSSIYFMF